MRTRISRFLAPALIGALATSACRNGGPTGFEGEAFDAASVDADLKALNTVLESGVWESFRALGPRFTTGGSVAVLGAASADAFLPDGSPETSRKAAARIARRLLAVAADAGLASLPRLPLEIRGTTFVLDPVTLQYVPDPERTGAPENGVRFILYAVNPVTREPLPDVEIGYADLTDEGDDLPDGVALRLQVVSGDVTYLDYLVTARGTETSGSLTATGFTTDGRTTLEFDIAVSATRDGETQTMEVRFDLAIPDHGFRASATVRNVDASTGATGQVEMEITVGEDVIVFRARGTAETIEAAFHVNGRLFATVSGDPRSPEIRGEGGRELTPQEWQALHQIVQLTGRVFEMFNHLMQPVGAILNVSMLP